jgi:hypothetical protein
MTVNEINSFIHSLFLHQQVDVLVFERAQPLMRALNEQQQPAEASIDLTTTAQLLSVPRFPAQ